MYKTVCSRFASSLINARRGSVSCAIIGFGLTLDLETIFGTWEICRKLHIKNLKHFSKSAANYFILQYQIVFNGTLT